MKPIFTRDRMIYGIIVSLIGLAGTYITSKNTASSAAQESLTNFKIQTVADIAKVSGDVETIKAVNTQINKRLEDMQGSLQTITSVLLNK